MSKIRQLGLFPEIQIINGKKMRLKRETASGINTYVLVDDYGNDLPHVVNKKRHTIDWQIRIINTKKLKIL